MRAGMILLAWVISAVLMIGLLMASGLVVIDIEVEDKDRKKPRKSKDSDSSKPHDQ